MTNATPAFPAPAGALRVYDWEVNQAHPDAAPGGVCRDFEGSSWTVDRGPGRFGVTVGIVGVQHGDGRTEREVFVDRLEGYMDRLSVGQARQLARALIFAAAEIHDGDQDAAVAW
ncbi:MAG: hypothetical protein ACREOE_03780 [Gemmatimonadales bacterium]